MGRSVSVFNALEIPIAGTGVLGAVPLPCRKVNGHILGVLGLVRVFYRVSEPVVGMGQEPRIDPALTIADPRVVVPAKDGLLIIAGSDTPEYIVGVTDIGATLNPEERSSNAGEISANGIVTSGNLVHGPG